MKRRPFFLWSDVGDAGGLAMTLEREGHDVTLYTKYPEARDVLQGYVTKRVLRPDVPTGAVVLFDATGHGAEGKRLRAAGHKVIGGNPYDHALEEDRAAAEALMESAGIAVPETIRFPRLAAAEAYLGKHTDGEWFFKASGHRLSTTLTTNGNAPTIARYLRYIRAHFGRDVDECVLQRRVSGTEIDTEGWFDGQRWVGPFNSTIEEKKFLAGNLGPRTGCESNVVWAWSQQTPKLVERSLLRMTEPLTREGYVGPLAFNAIVDKGELRGLEFSARFGFDALWAWLALMPEGTVGEQLWAFAHRDLDEWDVALDRMALTLRLSLSPYPYDDPKACADIRGLPLDPGLVEDAEDGRAILSDVMRGPDGDPVCAGRDGLIAVLVQVGDDMDELRAAVLAHAELLEIPGLQYRCDPVDTYEERIAGLKAQGYLGSGPPELALDRDDETDDRDADGEDTDDDDAEA